MTEYEAPEMEWYVLSRDEVYMVVSCIVDGDPMYGNGSWSLESGPHITRFQANASADELHRLTHDPIDLHFTIGGGPLSGRIMFFYDGPHDGARKLGRVHHRLDGWWTIGY